MTTQEQRMGLLGQDGDDVWDPPSASNVRSCHKAYAASTLVLLSLCVSIWAALSRSHTKIPISTDDDLLVWAHALEPRVAPQTLAALPASRPEASIQPQHELYDPHLRKGQAPVEVVWSGPTHAQASAVLVLAHECGQSALVWWPASEKGCPHCTGLPEHVHITEEALGRGIAVVSISSLDSRTRCWSTSKDLPRISVALKALMLRQGWSGLPLYGLGSASGASIIAALAQAAKSEPSPPEPKPIKSTPPAERVVAANATTVSNASNPADRPESFTLKVQGVVAIQAAIKINFKWPFPPTLFVAMPRDEALTQAANRQMRLLQGMGTKSYLLECHPIPITPSFFSSRIDAVSSSLSAKIHERLMRARILDPDGKLKQDPAISGWRRSLANLDIPGGLSEGTSMVGAELSVAFAHDQTTSAEHIGLVLDFLTSPSTTCAKHNWRCLEGAMGGNVELNGHGLSHQSKWAPQGKD